MNVHQLSERLGVKPDLEGYENEVSIPDLDLFDHGDLLPHGEKIWHPYFETRKVSPAAVEALGVEWSVADQAALFWVRTAFGKPVGHLLRYQEGYPRYRRQGQYTPLWPMDRFRGLEVGSQVILTEGAWSALRIRTVDPSRNVFALLGARAPKELPGILENYQSIILYDGDKAGERAREVLLSRAPTLSVYTISPSPDDLSDLEIEKLLRKIDRISPISF